MDQGNEYGIIFNWDCPKWGSGFERDQRNKYRFGFEGNHRTEYGIGFEWHNCTGYENRLESGIRSWCGIDFEWW